MYMTKHNNLESPSLHQTSRGCPESETEERVKISHNLLKYADLKGQRHIHLNVGFKVVHKGFEDHGCPRGIRNSGICEEN